MGMGWGYAMVARGIFLMKLGHVSTGGGHINLQMWWNCLELSTQTHTHKQVRVKLNKIAEHISVNFLVVIILYNYVRCHHGIKLGNGCVDSLCYFLQLCENLQFSWNKIVFKKKNLSNFSESGAVFRINKTKYTVQIFEKPSLCV